MVEHKLNSLIIYQCLPSEQQRFTKLSLISDLLCNDKLSSCKMKQLSSMLLSSYIILFPL